MLVFSLVSPRSGSRDTQLVVSIQVCCVTCLDTDASVLSSKS